MVANPVSRADQLQQAAVGRTGVASRILTLLLEHARNSGVQEVVLETTSTWDSAIAFYTKHGFAKTHEQNGDTHFAYHLR
jgi:ribosomal protein S18 acetylase RimI-like enzyme